MSNTSIIGLTRPSLLGDIIASLPSLNILLNSKFYVCSYVDRKCQQIVPFLVNHPLIDKIYVSEGKDKPTLNDSQFYDSFDKKLPLFPQVTDPFYYNSMPITEQLFRMTGLAYEYWNALASDLKSPKLYQWFDVKREEKTIAIWPFSGYTKDTTIDLRSPSKDWWQKLILELKKKGYKILQFGHPLSRKLDNVEDLRHLDLFSAIKLSLGCDLSITTDSGAGWILGAYGIKQIILYTNYQKNHTTNLDAMVPINYNGSINLFGNGGINSINHESILSKI